MAGSTWWGRRRSCSVLDHPRVGGEHKQTKLCNVRERGSSPRWRGAHFGGESELTEIRIIPALAGSTHWRTTRRLAAPDHPRVGGEHCRMRTSGTAARGSSPRWRGALLGTASLLLGAGIIPALAGSTARPENLRPVVADHPRVGGEHLGALRRESLTEGSSPRWRGAPSSDDLNRAAVRIIPALAGSTAPATRSSCSTGDHPRVGGEHPRALTRTPRPYGSSPRWRGALFEA